MPYASALTRLEDPRIKEIGQTEVGLSGAIAYDDEYTGPALDPAEGARLAGVIGDKKVLFMANHGISTVGATVATPMTCSTISSAPRRCRSTRCGPGSG